MNNEITRLLSTVPVITVDSIYNYDSIPVPRVTEIISKCLHVDSLMNWANSLGFRRMSYKNTLGRLADIGTATHENIDRFLSNEPIESFRYYESEQAFLSFIKWWNDIHVSNQVEVIYHEKPLICKYFGGTLDGLYRINGKIYLVDYKTSNHVTIKHFLQLSAYRYILRTEMNINIDGCIILQLSKEQPEYHEHVLDFSMPEHLKFINDCEMSFLSMVFSYYNLTNVEAEYLNIEWGGINGGNISRNE